jgi:hypothetical protein
MKRARLFGLLLIGVVGVVAAACGDDEEPIVDPATDAGPETSRVDTTPPAADTGVDTGLPIVDSGPEGGTTLDGGACGGEPVTIASVVPQFGWVSEKTALTITGTGFLATPKVYLRVTGGVDAGASDASTDASTTGGFVQVQHVAFVSSTSLTVVVPANLVGVGTYEVAVVNPNSCADVIASGLRIVANPPPRIDSVSPSAGTTQENVVSTIKGCYFPTSVGGLTFQAVSSTGMITQMSTQGAATCAGPSRPDCNDTNECTLLGVVGTKTPGLTSGAYLLRITNVADNTFGEYATFVVTNPSGNLTGGFVAEDALVTGRRSLGLVSGRINDASRFLYAIGGENAGGTALKTIEVGPLDRFGQLGKWFENKNQMELARSGPAVARHGKWIYVVGGTSSTGGTGGAAPTGTPLESFERAKILDPANAPVVTDPPGTDTTGGTLAAGTWYYKVAAIGSDADDPTGESIASDEVVATLGAAGKVTLTWQGMAGVTGWKIYRSAAVNGTSDSEVLLASITGGDASTTTQFVDDGSATAGTEKPMSAGSTGKWVKTDAAIGPRSNAAAVVAVDPANAANAFLYVSGGWGNCTVGQTTYGVVNCVHSAAINGTTGDLGAFSAFALLANARMRHGMEVMTKANGPAAFTDGGAASTATFLFVAGGRNAAGTFDGATNVEQMLVASGGGASNASFAAVVSGFSDARDALQFRIANGYGYAFQGGSVQGNNVNYSVSTSQGLATVGATAVTFPNWSNAAANLNGNEKVGRHGVVDESAYFYLVGGTTNDTDARSTVYRVLH